MTKTYELVVLLSPQLNDHQVDQVQHSLSDLVKKNGGTITSTDVWGKRLLSYAIEKHTEAFYILYNIEMDSAAVQAFDRDVRLSELSIRYLLVIKDEHAQKLDVKKEESAE